MALDGEVCNGCWKRGVCDDARCRCPCTRDGWRHTDDPRPRERVLAQEHRP